MKLYFVIRHPFTEKNEDMIDEKHMVSVECANSGSSLNAFKIPYERYIQHRNGECAGFNEVFKLMTVFFIQLLSATVFKH